MSETLNNWLSLSHPLAFIVIAISVGLLASFGLRKIGKGKSGCCGPKSESTEQKVSKGSCCN